MTARFDIDLVRDEAARCCDETARMERGERGRLLNPIDDGPSAEFSDPAFGVAAEVALAVCDAMLKAKAPFHVAFAWTTAAMLLRNGWQRGHRLESYILHHKLAKAN